MTLQRTYPFRRVSVDNLVAGETRIWWQIEPTFREIGPYVFQLQVGSTDLDEAIDWQNVGEPVVNGFMTTDPIRRERGSVLTTCYRVTLTTPHATYVSAASQTNGEINDKDWLMAREILRKEKLRHTKVSINGFLIKALRYGKQCPRCLDAMTLEPTDNNCPTCLGTGFERGFHPAVPLQCWDLTPQIIDETQDIRLKGTSRENAYVMARVIGYPALNNYDVWVNAQTNERWLLREIKVAAAVRGVPLIYEVRMGLIPFNNGIYQLSVEPETDPPSAPKTGSGCVTVTADWPNLPAGALKYADANGDYISDVEIHAYTKELFDSVTPVYPKWADAVANTKTTANGSWISGLKLNPGKYVLVYEKPNAYGPDSIEITIPDPCAVIHSSCSTSSCSTSSAEGVCPAEPQRKKYNNFWEI
jgi:hypothetical protein